MRCSRCGDTLDHEIAYCLCCKYPNPMFYPKKPPHNLNIFGTGSSLLTDDINIGSTYTTIGYSERGWGGMSPQSHLGAMDPYKEEEKKINKVKLLLK